LFSVLHDTKGKPTRFVESVCVKTLLEGNEALIEWFVKKKGEKELVRRAVSILATTETDEEPTLEG
jgi:hypothetical protein